MAYTPQLAARGDAAAEAEEREMMRELELLDGVQQTVMEPGSTAGFAPAAAPASADDDAAGPALRPGIERARMGKRLSQQMDEAPSTMFRL